MPLNPKHILDLFARGPVQIVELYHNNLFVYNCIDDMYIPTSEAEITLICKYNIDFIWDCRRLKDLCWL